MNSNNSAVRDRGHKTHREHIDELYFLNNQDGLRRSLPLSQMCSQTIMDLTLEFTKSKFGVNIYDLFCKHFMTVKVSTMKFEVKFVLLTTLLQLFGNDNDALFHFMVDVISYSLLMTMLQVITAR